MRHSKSMYFYCTICQRTMRFTRNSEPFDMNGITVVRYVCDGNRCGKALYYKVRRV